MKKKVFWSLVLFVVFIMLNCGVDLEVDSGSTGSSSSNTDNSVASDSYEPDDDYNSAKSIPTDGTVQSRSIHTYTDVDYISFTIIEDDIGKSVVIETSNGAGACDFDAILYLFDTDGTSELDFDDDGNPNGCERIEYQISSAGTYYVEVASYDSYDEYDEYDDEYEGEIGNYEITVNFSSSD